MIDWEEETYTLVLEDQTRGDLHAYLKTHPKTPLQTRRKWAMQVAQAVAYLQDVAVIHQDVAPRNDLLNITLDLRISDFGMSSYPGYTCLAGAPGPRYQSTMWKRGYVPTKADGIFGLGSVLYYIMSGEEPYRGLEDQQVEERFQTLIN